MRIRLILSLLALVLTLHASVHAQSATPTTAPSVIELGFDMQFELPSNWISLPDLAVRQGFFERTDAGLSHALMPSGSRPAIGPYAIIEEFGTVQNPTAADEAALAEQVRGYYATAVRPPSKAERLTGWKKATMTPVVFDNLNHRFSFSVVINFDNGEVRRVDCSGVISKVGAARVLSVWSDGSTPARPEVAAMLDSLRLAGPGATASIRMSALNFARVCGVLLILLVVGVQLFVWMRERRERQERLTELQL